MKLLKSMVLSKEVFLPYGGSYVVIPFQKAVTILSPDVPVIGGINIVQCDFNTV